MTVTNLVFCIVFLRKPYSLTWALHLFYALMTDSISMLSEISNKEFLEFLYKSSSTIKLIIMIEMFGVKQDCDNRDITIPFWEEEINKNHLQPTVIINRDDWFVWILSHEQSDALAIGYFCTRAFSCCKMILLSVFPVAYVILSVIVSDKKTSFDIHKALKIIWWSGPS